MDIEDLYKIAEKKGLECYGGDGSWNGDPYYKGPREPHEIQVKYSVNKEDKEKLFIDPDEALMFCAELDGGYALWHGSELVICFQESSQ